MHSTIGKAMTHDLTAAERERIKEQCGRCSDTHLRILVASWPGTLTATEAENELARRERERNQNAQPNPS